MDNRALYPAVEHAFTEMMIERLDGSITAPPRCSRGFKVVAEQTGWLNQQAQHRCLSPVALVEVLTK